MKRQRSTRIVKNFRDKSLLFALRAQSLNWKLCALFHGSGTSYRLIWRWYQTKRRNSIL